MIERDHSQHVPHQEVEGVFGAREEMFAVDRRHDVSVPVHEAQEVLQHPAATFAAAEDRLCQFVVELLEFLVDVLQDQSDDPANCDDQRAEGQRAEVESESSIDCSCQSEERNVVFVQRPIPSGEGSGQDHLSERRDEENQPEESDHVDCFEIRDQLRCTQSDVEARGCALSTRTALIVTQPVELLRNARISISD